MSDICMNLLVLTRQAEARLMEVPHAPMPSAGACRSVQIRSSKVPLC